jgi:Protein of unknown function (DUF2829).
MCANIEMPRYECHKQVWALKIKSIQLNTENGATITPEEPGFAPFSVDAAYMAKHNPQVGGYFVLYKDGYRSFSPAEAFEDGYTLATNGGAVNFGTALEALKQGKRVARAGWNGKGMFLFLLPGGTVPKSAIHDSALRAVIDEQISGDTFDALPSIRMWTTNSQGRRAVLTGWLASQTDMLSNDWVIFD